MVHDRCKAVYGQPLPSSAAWPAKAEEWPARALFGARFGLGLANP
jgi:hypothetical protein